MESFPWAITLAIDSNNEDKSSGIGLTAAAAILIPMHMCICISIRICICTFTKRVCVGVFFEFMLRLSTHFYQ